MEHLDIRNRAKGALVGAFIGEALAMGPHWYYNLEELRRDYGDWISDYTDPCLLYTSDAADDLVSV